MNAPRKRSSRFSRVSLPGIALAGALLSLALSLFVWDKQKDDWQQRFDNGVYRRQQAIQRAFNDSLEELDDIGRFVEASERVTADEFNYYNRPMLRLFHSIAWIVPRPGESPVAGLYDQSPECVPVDAKWRYPVTLMSAREPADHVLGLDLRCDATRVAVMHQARDSGREVATAQVRGLLRDGPVMAVFRPIYWRVPSTDQQDRRQALRGFIAVGMTITDSLRPQLDAMEDTGHYVIRLTDLSAGGRASLLHVNEGMEQPDATGTTTRLAFAGRTLDMTILPSRAFWRQRHNISPLLVGLAGLCFTAMLMSWMRSQSKRRLQAEMLAIARSDDLIDREARLVALVQHAPIAIMRCSADGVILDANPAAGRIMGGGEAALQGRSFVSLFSSWAGQVFRERWQEPNWLELEVLDAAGERIPVLARILSMRQPDGAPYAWAMLEDLRAVRHNERLKREFVATISHELRTPLTAIKGALELVRSGTLSAMPAEEELLLGMAAQNAESLERLINDLLDVERLELGKLSLRMESETLAPLVRKAQRLSQPLLTEKRLTWDVQPIPANLLVMVDADRLIQVLKNLFSNAVKFSPAGGCIRVGVSVHGQHLQLSVSDEGAGIPAEFMPQLFQPFAQADGSDRRRAGGSGLGLAISRGLIERMGGHIRAESVPGEGATFIIELPCEYGLAVATGDQNDLETVHDHT